MKLTLRRDEDIRMTGKRHPYSSDFKIGLSKDGQILAYQVTFYQNAGAAADLSPAVLERSLFHTTNSYFVPNVKATALCCRTNLPPYTAFRGFGAPQAMFVFESAIFKAAEQMGIDPWSIQKQNLLREGDSFPYGMKLENSQARRCWAIIEVTVDCLRGTYQIDTVKVVHDVGKSLNPLIDRGQVEGGLVQGIGWMTIEELKYADNGQLLTDTLSTYKVPDIYFAPQTISVHFLENSDNPPGLFDSKAIGEPPFMYGIGAYFAIWQAMKAFRPDLPLKLSAPLTPEKLLLSFYTEAN